MPQPDVVTSENIIVILLSQLSVAEAFPNAGEAGQLIGELTDGHVMTGAIASTTLIVLQQTICPSSQRKVSHIVNCPQVPAVTFIEAPVDEPAIEPLPEIDQLCDGFEHKPE